MPPRLIMIVRHAEKPVLPPPHGIGEDGVQDEHSLIARGWQRAGALVPFFATPGATTGVEVPTTIYAAAVGGATLLGADGNDLSKSLRPRETVTPLSRKLGLMPNLGFGVGQESALADDILKQDGAVLVAWEHTHIPALAAALSPAAPAVWPDGQRFDLVWILTRAG